MEDKDIYKPRDTWSKEDYKRYALSLFKRNATFDRYRRSRIAEFYEYYYGRAVSHRYNNLLTVHEGPKVQAGGEEESIWGETPFEPINFDSISPKVNVLLGELEGRGFEPRVEAVNREAMLRKKSLANQMEYLAKVQPMLQRAAKYTGMPIGVNENIPITSEQIKEYLEERKDLYEALTEEGLKDGLQRDSYKYGRENIFLDLLVSGECHAKVEKIGEYVHYRRVNPMNAVPDFASEGDYLDDAQFFAEAYYMSIPECIEKFDLDEEKMEELIDRHKRKEGYSGIGTEHGTVFSPFLQRFGTWRDYEFDRVFVMEAEWISNEPLTQKVTHDKHDNMHVHNYYGKNDQKLSRKERKDKRNSIEEKPVQVRRKAVLIGGDCLVEWGKTGDYERDPENPALTKTNYVSLIHSYNAQNNTSLVERIAELQDFKNYCLTIMQKEITRSIGGVVAVDLPSIAEFYGDGVMAARNVLQGAKAYGVILTDTAKDSADIFPGGRGAIPLENVQPQASMLIRECLSTAVYLEEQMMKLTGINEARQGTAGERTLATTNTQQLNQSSMITSTYFDAFRGWEDRLCQKWVEKMVMCWHQYPERYEHLALRLGRDLPDDFKIDLQRYRAYVAVQPMGKEAFLATLQFSLQQGNLDAPDYLELIMMVQEGSMRQAIREYITAFRKRQQMMMQQQQMMAQQEAAARQREKEMELRGRMAVEDKKGQWGSRQTGMKEQHQDNRNILQLGQKDREAVSQRMMVEKQMEENDETGQ